MYRTSAVLMVGSAMKFVEFKECSLPGWERAAG